MQSGLPKMGIVIAAAVLLLVPVVACGDETADPVAIDIERDLSYGPAPFGTLDVYAPSDAGPWPVAIVAHGFG